MVRISIVIPVYNVEQYVQRCLESVIAQDKAEADIECLIIDDGSPDKSMSIVRQTIESYNGPIEFVLLNHEKNRGLSAARNTGIHHAKGDYILFIDSDDYLLPDSVQYMLSQLTQYPQVDMIIGNVNNSKAGNLMIGDIAEPLLIDDCNVFFQRVLRHKIYLYAWNKLIKRNLLVVNDICFVDGILYEDQCWSYQLFSCVSSVLLLPRVTYFYEYNQQSIVHTTFTSGKADLAVKSYTISINKMLDNPPVPAKYKKNLTVDYLLFMVNFLMNGVDVLSRFNISDRVADGFLKVRLRLLFRSLSYGRLLLSFFFLLLFPPLSYMQKVRFFRHHYYDLELIVNRCCHVTDFMHRRKRI